jgi:hypothetical protein
MEDIGAKAWLYARRSMKLTIESLVLILTGIVALVQNSEAKSLPWS